MVNKYHSGEYGNMDEARKESAPYAKKHHQMDYAKSKKKMKKGKKGY